MQMAMDRRTQHVGKACMATLATLPCLSIRGHFNSRSVRTAQSPSSVHTLHPCPHVRRVHSDCIISTIWCAQHHCQHGVAWTYS
jgi:hypothetical protein